MDAIAQFIIDFFNWLDFFTDWLIETGLADHTAEAIVSVARYSTFTLLPVLVEWITKLSALING